MTNDQDTTVSCPYSDMRTVIEIVPGVLTYDEGDFKAHLLHAGLNQVAKTFHVDVLDGSMFGTKCWAEASIVGTWKKLPNIELHCMVQDPMSVVEPWKRYVPSLKRVIVHREIHRPLSPILETLKLMNLETVIAINPETQVDEIKNLLIDGLLIMSVHPGASGQSFLGEAILSKIKRARRLFPELVIEVDGGVSADNLGSIVQAGAKRCVATSALWKSANPEEEYELLRSKIF